MMIMNANPSMVESAKCELAAEIVRAYGAVQFRATGSSMLPAVWPGDILSVRRRPFAELSPGRILLCYRNQSFVAHRLISKHAGVFITQGDSLLFEDVPFHEDEVLGEVVSILRDGRPVPVSPAPLSKAVAAVLRHSEFCTRVLLRLTTLSKPARMN
jgi:hypothetical protein